jgi:hypothetical protein
VTVVPKAAGVMNVARAAVVYKYRTPAEGEDGEGGEEEEDVTDASTFSSSPGKVEVVTEAAYARHLAAASAGGLTTVASYVAALAALAWPYSVWSAAAGGAKPAGSVARRR